MNRGLGGVWTESGCRQHALLPVHADAASGHTWPGELHPVTWSVEYPSPLVWREGAGWNWIGKGFWLTVCLVNYPLFSLFLRLYHHQKV